MECPSLALLPGPPAGKTGWPWNIETPPLPKTMANGRHWPAISIVTPSFNQGIYLEETLRSVLLQGYPNLEFYVMDGNSTDESVQILRKYSPWLTGWVSEADRGQSHAINKGWTRASGDLIAYLNSDDFYYPGALQKVAEAWNMDPSVAFITGGVAYTGEWTAINEQKPFLRAEPPLDLSLLEPGAWFLPQQSTFFARQHLDQVGRFLREELHFTMDRELMYRMCRHGRVLLLPDILAGDRQHTHSKRLSQTVRMYREDATALEYCTWGGRKEAAQRKRVARWRLAQGHFLYADRSPSGLSKLVHLTAAAYNRPTYLRRRSFYKTLARAFGLRQ